MNKQEHILSIVGEECAEISQRCSKAMRFGMKEIQKDQPLTNSERIVEEFNDLIAVMEMLYDKPIIEIIIPELIDAKKSKVEKYLSYSQGLGTLT